MQSKGFAMEVGVQEIINKLKKLRQKYKTVKVNKKESGNSKGREWKFFKKMDSILSTRHNVQPPAIVDTMAEDENNSGKYSC